MHNPETVVQKDWENREEIQDLKNSLQLLSSFVSEVGLVVRERISALNERLDRLEALVNTLELIHFPNSEGRATA